jgi:hypothetical protein
MALIGCMSVFNEAALIRSALWSLRAVVDRVVVVDGAVSEFPATGISTDGTREALLTSEHVLLVDALIDCANRPEHEKRSRYFVGRPGDWYLVLDGDEILVPRDRGALRLAVNQCKDDSMTLDLVEPGKRDTWQTPRLIRHVEGMRYWPDHCEVWAGERCVMSHNRPRASTEEHNPNGMIVHLPFVRGERRERDRDIYHDNLSKKMDEVYAERRARG